MRACRTDLVREDMKELSRTHRDETFEILRQLIDMLSMMSVSDLIALKT